MMQFEFSSTVLRSYKGAPISVLIAFMVTRQQMTALELQQWTGYKGDNITTAVRLLTADGWLSARSPRGPWCLCEGMQLPLMNADSDLIGVMPSSSSSSNRTWNVPSNLQEQEEQDESDLIGVVAALDAAGIREPKRSTLAKLEHVTAEMITAHVEQCKAEGLEIGTAIHRIQYNWAYEVPRAKQPKKAPDVLSFKIDQLRARAQSDDEEIDGGG